MGRRPSSSTDGLGARRRRSRRSKRGIAVAESLILITTLSFFLFGMPFAYRLFAVWYEAQAGTRNSTLSIASNGCRAGTGNGNGGSYGLDQGGDVSGARQVSSQKGEPAAVNATNSSLNVASGTASRSVGIGRFSATINANSFGTGNEVPADTSVSSWSQHGFEQHQGQGGGGP